MKKSLPVFSTPLAALPAALLGAALGIAPALAQSAPTSGATAAASQAASPDLAASIASDPFVRLDKDGDGAISKPEASRKIRKAWSHYDRNGDGKVDSAEYAAAAD